MRAGVYCGPGRVALRERPVPEPGPGEVRVRVTACGVCGSDLHLWRSAEPLIAPGTTMGHEIAGTVDALGPDRPGPGARGFAPGDRVTVEPLTSCGDCPHCSEGRDSICPQLAVHGLHRPGGFADAVVVPAQRLYRTPPDLAPPLAALAEPFAVAVHGLRLAGAGPAQPPRCLLILGAGAIGLAVAAVARNWAFDGVLVTARHPHQARLAKDLGARHVIDAGDHGGLDGLDADLVVETVGGSASTMSSAAAALRPGGTICVLGVFGAQLTLDPMVLLRKEARLQWSNCYARRPGDADFTEAIRILAADPEACSKLVTHRVPLDDLERAFELAGDKRSGAVKVSVIP